MKSRCEEASRRILPAVRALIANKLAKKGLSGKKIAQIMGITPSAVTYYLHKNRGKLQVEDAIPKDEIDRFVEQLIQGKLSEEEKIKKLCKICRLVKLIAK